MYLRRQMSSAGVKHGHFATCRTKGWQHFNQFSVGEEGIYGDTGCLNNPEACKSALYVCIGLIDCNNPAARIMPVLTFLQKVPGKRPVALAGQEAHPTVVDCLYTDCGSSNRVGQAHPIMME
ncbi:hypothetical protein AUC60_02270 [Pseudomonas caspiana]|uniref:Uncharacterized protein n=1 Tax=Pseudomonas caspiana TaxID=1451454 RepID=A0A1Y3PEB1_9PSED|nr:hypothetical protein AUC60_02270 [Pseudomonas caspiana]